MLLEEMKLRLKEIATRLQAIRATKDEENRSYIQEELDEMESLSAEFDHLEKSIELEERHQTIEKKMAASANPELDKKVKPKPDEKRYQMQVTQPGPRRDDPNRFFGSIGEQFMAIYKAGMGERTDPRLYEVRAATGLSEGVGSDGGFLLQPSFAAMIMEDAFSTGRLVGMCRQQPISGNSNSLKIPAVDETSRASTRHGGTLGYWVDEAAVKTASKPKIRQLQLTLNKMVVLVYATDELLMDAAAMESFVRNSAAHEIGFQFDDAIVNGTGAGRPLGILNAGCLVSQSAEAGQAAATVLYENVIKMWSRLFAASQTQAVWLINSNVFPQLAQMSLPVGTGGSAVWLPASGAAGSPYSTLMGRPVMPIEQCASVGTVGDIILADFRNGYIWASKGGLQSDVSIHVRFVYDESVFRFVVRVDGQPVRASALTPYKGGSSWTQSHFVALETRS